MTLGAETVPDETGRRADFAGHRSRYLVWVSPARRA